MPSISAELEQEQEFEQLELEGETELELLELENETENERGPEQEAFFNHLAAMADRGGRSQALRRVALAAAREALRGAARRAPAVEGEFEHELPEFEITLELNPARRSQLAAQLEHMAHAAAEASSEQEAAEQFLPLIPFAAKFALPLLGKALPAASKLLLRAGPKLIQRVAPSLTRGVGNLARALFRNQSTRPLLRALPRIARGTVTSLVRQIANGGQISPKFAAQALARQTLRTLRSPQTLARTYQRSVARDRQYHQHNRQVLGVPGAGQMRLLCGNCGQRR
jgi:hypothetical protein